MDRYEYVRKSTDRIKKYGREKLKSKHTRPDCRLHGSIQMNLTRTCCLSAGLISFRIRSNGRSFANLRAPDTTGNLHVSYSTITPSILTPPHVYALVKL